MKELPLSTHRQLIFRYLLEHGVVNKSELSAVITSPPILNREIEKMEKDGLVIINESRIGRRTFKVELTETGKETAYQLKRAEETAKGMTMDERVTIKMPADWKDRFKGLSAMTHLNVLDDHVAIQEIDSSGKTTSVVMVYVKRINSHFELWCEKDESKECKHVDFAWSLPQMRALIEEHLKKGKIKEVGRVN